MERLERFKPLELLERKWVPAFSFIEFSFLFHSLSLFPS